jgi:hypothetical protein
VTNVGYIACVGQHRECGGGVYVQIQQQAILVVQYDGGKVVSSIRAATYPVIWRTVLVRDGHDDNQLAPDGIAKCVRKLLEHTAPNVANFQRIHQGHVVDALCGGTHLLRKCAAKLGTNRPLPGAGIIKFALGKLCKSNVHHVLIKNCPFRFIADNDLCKHLSLCIAQLERIYLAKQANFFISLFPSMRRHTTNEVFQICVIADCLELLFFIDKYDGFFLPAKKFNHVT